MDEFEEMAQYIEEEHFPNCAALLRHASRMRKAVEGAAKHCEAMADAYKRERSVQHKTAVVKDYRTTAMILRAAISDKENNDD